MSQEISITHTVHLKNSAIYIDGHLFLQDIVDLEPFLTMAYKKSETSYPKFYKMDTLSKLGFIASELLLKNASFDDIDAFKKGLIIQNHSSSLETDKKYQASIKDIASPALFVYTLPNIVLGEIAIRHKFKGENTFFIGEEFNAHEITNYTNLLLNQNVLSKAIVGYLEFKNNQADVFLALIEKTSSHISMTAENLMKLYLLTL